MKGPNDGLSAMIRRQKFLRLLLKGLNIGNGLFFGQGFKSIV
jgi:hypothetical protein